MTRRSSFAATIIIRREKDTPKLRRFDVDVQALGSSIPIGARSLLYIAMAFGCGLRGIADLVLLAVESLCSRVFDKTSLDCIYLMKTPYELVEVSPEDVVGFALTVTLGDGLISKAHIEPHKFYSSIRVQDGLLHQLDT